MMDLYEQLSAERKLAQSHFEVPTWMTTGGYQMYKEKLQYKEETVTDAFRRVAKEAAVYSSKYRGNSVGQTAQRYFELLWRGWLAPSTPVLANMGTDRGLPVSCSGSYVPDSIEGFYGAFREAAMLTKTGHGCSCYLGDIRPRGSSYGDGEGTSDGVMPVIQQMLTTVNTVSQGATRRGATAFYIPLTHGDIREVLDYHLANPKKLQVGYIMSDDFIARCDEGDSNYLTIYKRFLKVRAQTGKAYLIFTDKANRHVEEMGTPFESDIKASNLCSEIMLPSNEDNTFTCVLSSINAAKVDEWGEDEEFIEDCIYFLNGVLDSYLAKAWKYPGLEKAIKFSTKYRALGLGVLGFCTMLQQRKIPLGSFAARDVNDKFFSSLYAKARAAGDNAGNATVLAIAPNVSSALVCGGVSQGIEPFSSNVFTQETSAGDIYRMNPVLLDLMKEKGIATEENIQKIKTDLGSIQENDLFTAEEKEVFKTAYEENQSWLVKLADDRGRYLDQGQSLNLFFADSADEEYINEVHREAIRAPYVKSLYYFNTKVGVMGDNNACFMCET